MEHKKKKKQSKGDGNLTCMMCQYLLCTIFSLKIRRAESIGMKDDLIWVTLQNYLFLLGGDAVMDFDQPFN